MGANGFREKSGHLQRTEALGAAQAAIETRAPNDQKATRRVSTKIVAERMAMNGSAQVSKQSDSPFTPEQHRAYFSARLPQEVFNGHRETAVHCPFHDDNTPSMSINLEKGVWCCHAGCGGGGVLDFEKRLSNCDHLTARKTVAELLGQPPPARSGTQEPEAIYDYWDEHHHNLVFRKLRFPGKRFVLQQPVGKSWRATLAGIKEKPLYGLSQLITSDTALVAEGEKDCDRLADLHLEELYPQLRFAYVTNFDGAGHWQKTYARYFAGKDVVIFADNDEPGRKHAREVARSLTGIASGIRLVEFPELPEKADVSDWLDTQGENESDLRARLMERVKKTALWHDDAAEWKTLFHSYDEVLNAPPTRFAIEGFLQEDGVTLIGGLAGHGKTLCMLAMTRALLEGGKLFHHFPVNETAKRVIYLIPESALGPFSARLKTFHLEDHIRDGRLFCRTLSAPGSLALTDPRLLEAVQDADVFLDTAIRFMVGEENSATEQKLFAETLFNLQRAGARTITGAHHSPKSFGRDTFMTLENVLRGSGDIGAMVVTCWGLAQIDAAQNRIFVQNVKPRDFMPCPPFIIQGRPSLNETGYFDLTEPPGFAADLSTHRSADKKTGRPTVPDRNDKFAEAMRLKEQGMSLRDIAAKLRISKSTVSRWFSDDEEIK